MVLEQVKELNTSLELSNCPPTSFTSPFCKKSSDDNRSLGMASYYINIQLKLYQLLSVVMASYNFFTVTQVLTSKVIENNYLTSSTFVKNHINLSS